MNDDRPRSTKKVIGFLPTRLGWLVRLGSLRYILKHQGVGSGFENICLGWHGMDWVLVYPDRDGIRNPRPKNQPVKPVIISPKLRSNVAPVTPPG